MAFGSFAHIGVSLMCLSSPKSIRKTAPFRSQNFVNKGFFDVRGKNTVNPDGFTSILTMPQRKILVSKSDSSLNALARGGFMNYFDLHCDTAYEIFKNETDFFDQGLAVNFNSAPFDNWKQVFAFWIKDNTENPFSLYQSMREYFDIRIKTAPKNLKYYTAIEGGAVLEDKPERLYTLKKDGIKFLSLAWNFETLLAGGIKSEQGLTSLGKDTIFLMNELKIACDLSHLNEKSFCAAAEFSDFPLATHSNCYSYCPNPRNLKEWQIKAIAEKGGIIGLCFYPEFLNGDVFEAIYINIYELLEKGLENAIAIGSDFDGGKMDKKLDNINKIPDLYNFLEGKGVKKPTLNKIFYENADKFIAKL